MVSKSQVNYLTEKKFSHKNFLISIRTKWKRQAAVSLEFLEQQGSIAAVHRLLQHHHAATGVGNPHHSLWYSPYLAPSTADALFALQARSSLDTNKSSSDSLSPTMTNSSPNKSV